MKRDEFVQKLRAKKYAREYVESLLEEEHEKEEKLRGVIRELIKEAKSTGIPYQNTGINILEDVLKKIVPVIREDYKDLTTSKRQRKSFRAHMINAVKQSLLPIQNFHKAAEEFKDGRDDEVKKEQENEKFIDVPDGTEKSQQSNQRDDEEKVPEVPGSEKTGRNVAIRAYGKIESNIIDGYELLAHEEDRELFYDYLLSNLKLYFDRWEDEISSDFEGGDEVPDEVLEENVINPSQSSLSDKSNERDWKGWRAFKEEAQQALQEDDYKKFKDKSPEEIKDALHSLRDEFMSAENPEDIEKLEKRIGGALAALWKKTN